VDHFAGCAQSHWPLNKQERRKSMMLENEKDRSEKTKIEDKLKSGANWFFWIAGLSFINSILFLCSGKWNFIVGLGITQLVDVIRLDLVRAIGNAGYIVACALSAIAAGIFIFFGIFARKKRDWAFVAGMLAYAFDGQVFLLVQDYLGVGFHIFVLFLIAGGFKASKMLGEDATFFAL
jgi:hypothetical protein